MRYERPRVARLAKLLRLAGISDQAARRLSVQVTATEHVNREVLVRARRRMGNLTRRRRRSLLPEFLLHFLGDVVE